MSEVGELYKALRAHSRQKRASNRERGRLRLKALGIEYEERNYEAHLIVYPKCDAIIDYWPGTGKFKVRGSKQGRGIRQLLKVIQELEQQESK